MSVEVQIALHIKAEGHGRSRRRRRAGGELLHLHGEQFRPHHQHHGINEKGEEEEDHVDHGHDLHADLMLTAPEGEHGESYARHTSS